MTRGELARLRAEADRLAPGADPGPVLALADALVRAGRGAEAWARLWARAEVVPDPALAARLAALGPGGRGAGDWPVRYLVPPEDLGKGRRAALAVAFAPDGERLAVGYASGHVRVLEPGRGAVRGDLGRVHAKACSALAWAADGARLASGGGDGRAVAWDLGSGRPVAALEGEDGLGERVESVTVRPGILAAAGRSRVRILMPDGTVRACRIGGPRAGGTGEPVPRADPFRGVLADGAEPGLDEALARAARELGTGPGRHGPLGPTGLVMAAARHRRILVASSRGTLLFDPSGAVVHRGGPLPLRLVRGAAQGQAPARALSPDGLVLVLGSHPASTADWVAGGAGARGGALVVPVDDPGKAVTVAAGEVVCAAAFSPWGDRLALGTLAGGLVLLEAEPPGTGGGPEPAPAGRPAQAVEVEGTPGLEPGRARRLWSRTPPRAKPRRWTYATPAWLLLGADHLWAWSRGGVWSRLDLATRGGWVAYGEGPVPPGRLRAEHPAAPARAEGGEAPGDPFAAGRLGLGGHPERERVLARVGGPRGRFWPCPLGRVALVASPVYGGEARAWLVGLEPGGTVQDLGIGAPLTCAGFSPRGTRVALAFADEALWVVGGARGRGRLSAGACPS